jgi:anti-sigma factor RsiW
MGKLGSGMGGREHAYVENRLSAYVDDQVSGRERRRIEAHLAHCETCRADLRTLRWTVGLLHQAPQVKAPRRFVVREADLDRAQRPMRRMSPLMVAQWATAVVALLLVLVLGGDLLAGRGRLPIGSASLRGERESVAAAVTQAAETGPAKDEVTAQAEDRVAQALPEATPSAPPMIKSQAAGAPTEEEAPKAAESERAAETPMAALKAPPNVEATEAVTATEEGGVMLAAPGPSPTAASGPQGEPQGGGGLPPTPLSTESPAVEPPVEPPAAELPTEPPAAELQPTSQEHASRLAAQAAPTPSAVAETYGLTARAGSEGGASAIVVLVWRGVEAILGLALVVLLVVVVWMRSRR